MTWNARKSAVAPWWEANSKELLQLRVDGLARALQNWSKSRRGERAGAAMGFPRLRTRRRSRRSVQFTTGAIRVEADRHHVVLPRIGRVRTHESIRKLARRLQAGTARILSATVSFTGGRWQDPCRCWLRARPGPHTPTDPNMRWSVWMSRYAICWSWPPPTGWRSAGSRRPNR